MQRETEGRADEEVDGTEVVYRTEVPADEGVISVTVCRAQDEVRFVAAASNRTYAYHLRFRADSPDPDMADYFVSLTKPEGAKLFQVSRRPPSRWPHRVCD